MDASVMRPTTAQYLTFHHVVAVLALAIAALGYPSVVGSLAAQTAKTPPAKPERQAAAAPRGEQGIVVLVNDEPITAYQIEQRARFLAANTNIGERAKDNFQRLIKSESTNAQFRALQEEVVRANQGKTREQIIALIQERQKQFAAALQKKAVDSARSAQLPKLRKDAKEELIDERLKLQEAKKLGIEVPDDEVKRFLSDLAGRNKLTYDQFSQHLKGMGVDIATIGDKMRSQRAWRNLVMRRFGAQVAVTLRDVDRALSSSSPERGEDAVELQISKITLGLPSLDQVALTKRYAEAASLRRKFAGCRSMGALAKSVSSARLEDSKFVRPSSVPEPTRSMLLSAKDGDMLPPTTTAEGVELYAVCGRRAVAVNDAQRSKTQEDLQYKQLELLAQRHMRNLRQDAHIEYR
jgi:peptidyl-prolyl cis-trans isomerase SurA